MKKPIASAVLKVFLTAAAGLLLASCLQDRKGGPDEASELRDVAPVIVRPRVSSPNPEGSPVARHGKLRVSGSSLVDADGRPVQLRGMSSFWINWEEGARFVNRDAIAWLARDWRISVYRIAVGVEPKGAYLSNPVEMLARTTAAIDACIEAGVYVIVDWHAHETLHYAVQETAFFKGIAQAYGKYPNLIYEIWNEPVHLSWKDRIKPYSEAIIRNAIRPADPDNVILVGTSTWSQDVDECARDPIEGTNLMYTLHFYAGSHGESLRKRAETARKSGLPIFVSEWGISQADGGSNGLIFPDSSDLWLEWMDGNSISWVNWSVSDKEESAAALKPGANATGGWGGEDLTPSGLYVRGRIRKRPD